MNEITAQIGDNNLASKFLAISLREQVLVLLTGMVVIGLLAYTFLVEPVAIESARLEKKLVSAKNTQSDLNEQIIEVKDKFNIDPNAPIRQRISELNEELASIDIRLQEQTSHLVPANQVASMLKEVLANSKGIKLIELTSIAPTPIYLSKEVDGQPRQADLYRHGVSITIEGGYFDIHHYLEKLEGLKWQFFWKKFDYQVDAYPTGKIELEIYTLSTSKAFIGF